MGSLMDAIFGIAPAVAGIAAGAVTGGAAAPIAAAAASTAVKAGENAIQPPQQAPPPPPPPPQPALSPQMQTPQLVASDRRLKTGAQSGTEAVKDFLSRFGDSALTPPAPVRSDARAKKEVFAAGLQQGRMEATARWAQAAPDIPHTDVGPDMRGLVRGESLTPKSEGAPGQAWHGAGPAGLIHVQTPQTVGQPLPMSPIASFPGSGPVSQVRPMPGPAPVPEDPAAVAANPLLSTSQRAVIAGQDPHMVAPIQDERLRQLAVSDHNLKTQVRPAERSLKDFLSQVYAHAGRIQ